MASAKDIVNDSSNHLPALPAVSAVAAKAATVTESMKAQAVAAAIDKSEG
jgi:hypothetical protein